MPSWCGWNEEQVRAASHYQTEMFTAINTSQRPETPLQEAKASAHVPAPHGRRRVTASVVSEYLGISKIAKQTVPAAATHLQKATSKGKKRTSIASAPRESKCRKSNGTTTATVPVAKIAQQKAAKHPNKSAAHEQTSPAQSTKSLREKTQVSSFVVESADASSDLNQHAVGSISSVYALTTSMDVFDSTSIRTSVDSIKAGGNLGCTLYQTAPSSGSMHTAVEFSTHLLPSAPATIADDSVDDAKESDMQNPATLETAKSAQRPLRKAKKDAIQKNSLLLRGLVGKDTGIPASSQRSLDPAQPTRRPHAVSETPASRIIIPLRESDSDDSEPAFAGEVDESALIDLAMAIEDDDELNNRPQTPPPRSHKQNMRDVDEHEDYGGALLSHAERELLEQNTSSSQATEPIVRQAFPRAILDRSSIAGASNATLLRTCFRLGEALNTGSQAVRTNSNVVLELYARVTSSWREPPPGRKQHFVFADNYHDKPPHLEGTFELYNQATLWDLDSQAFLGASASGTLCRAIVRMKRNAQQKWRLEILSIWEATWEDVEFAAGICGSSDPGDSSD